MPPKQKKPKTDKSVKAIAKTKRGSAQAQTTKVVVNVGKAPARRRRVTKPKPKGSQQQQQREDGWYPPQNLSFNGQPFQTTLRYINVPSPAFATPAIPTPSQSNLFAGAPIAPTTLIDSTQEELPPQLPESDLVGEEAPNITEFLQEYKKSKKPKERMTYFDETESEGAFIPFTPKKSTFAPMPEPEPQFAPPAPSTPFFIPDFSEQSSESNRISLLNEIKGLIGQLEDTKVMGKRGKNKDKFLNDVFGDFGKYRGTITRYDENELKAARENIRNIYNV